MICGQDPLRRRAEEIDGEEKATGEVRLDGEKNDRIGPPNGGRSLKSGHRMAAKGDAVPLAVDQWYDFHEFGCHLGNVG